MNHADRRSGKLTGSVMKVVMDGSAYAKNSLVRSLNNPRKFFFSGNTLNMPAPLAWGHEEEDWLRSMFWEHHPEYEFMTGDDAQFIDPASSLWNPAEAFSPSDACRIGTSPDGVLLRMDQPAGLIEIKSPYNIVALKKAINGGWVKRWLHQIDWGMLLSGLPETWLVIGNRTEPPASPYRYKEILITADAARHRIMAEKAREFIARWKVGLEHTDEDHLTKATKELRKLLEIDYDF